MSPNVPNLTAKQLLAIQSLSEGSTIAEASQGTQVSEKTIDRWLKLPEFQTVLQEKKRQIYNASIARLIHGSRKAVDALVAVLDDKKAPSAVKVNAAKSVLEATYKGFALIEVEHRLSELEQATNERH